MVSHCIGRTGLIEAGPFCMGGYMEFDYKSTHWKKKRVVILKRDGYMCVECRKYGRIKEAVTVHHIKHVDEYPELAYIDSNLESLCNSCHNKMHPEKGKHHR